VSRLEGTVLVTGGTGALGQAVVAELLEAGARVVATWIAEKEKRRVEDALGARDTLELIEADLSSSEGAAATVAAASGGDSALAAVVNLVGGYAGSGRLHEAPEGEIERMVEFNLMTAHRVSRAALPAMVEQGGGSIVCVGTKAAVEPFSGASGYVISKAAVLSLVRVLAIEYRDDGIRANAIMPSVIDTPANRRSMPDADHSAWVPPAQIARVVRFLCSPDSLPVSGAPVPVYGRAG
jgi:NAD(P)-dependent dehydrogenase (short-subunit alcohol dehydrogenase family)